jgi:hypothetical protein
MSRRIIIRACWPSLGKGYTFWLGSGACCRCARPLRRWLARAGHARAAGRRQWLLCYDSALDRAPAQLQPGGAFSS